MKKIKILGIAPYESMKSLMRQAAAKRNDIELTAFTGDLETGVEIASKYTPNDFDFIVSRGGTAQMIRQVSQIPVVEIVISLYDLLRCMQLAQNSSCHYALIGFPNITKNTSFLSTLLHYNLDIFTIHNQQEAECMLKKINDSDYDVILSDSISNSLSKGYRFRSILITSGTESVEATFDQAVLYGSMYRETLHQSKLYRCLLETHPFDVYAFSEDGEMLYHSRKDLYSGAMKEFMSELVPSIIKDGHKKVYRKYSGALASISGSLKKIDGENIVQFYVNLRKVPLTLLKNGLHYLDKEELLNDTDNFYSNVAPQSFIETLTRDFQVSHAPVFILGERGTDKQKFIEMLYIQSDEQNNPLALLDCSRLTNSKNWDFLMQDMNSPLSDTGTTIYIRNIDLLAEIQFQELIYTIKDTNLHKRNRIIFELTHAEKEAYPERYLFIRNTLNCITIEIPPLRKMTGSIPHMAGLFIGIFNVEYGKEIAGFEPEALELLQSYDWPGNYTQLRRVISRLAATAEEPYLNAKYTRSILLDEQKKFQSSSPGTASADQSSAMLDLHSSLDQINRKIAEIVVEEENGNQSAAARRLGISRTTLWRLLKNS
ncbi:MAG TPA: PrpR N-terminal domain-containing protein [Candidatus Eisenbergiella merdavium]|uniref:PrpR N-terminal domain-containing protein n=1 Tax=Candidatus Eisenbergiella merdavium TaxID=2838551 RepID=A0A9D2NEU3_9FIRM|nr:PrpR N-terminal domain-containing protein [Candidatus Eisenbergiella merdavium]